MFNPILWKIKRARLVGRGGAEFPTATKWKFVRRAKGRPKFVVCNASEGELGLFKDYYILQHFPEKVFEGMKIAMKYLRTREAYININKKYYQKLKHKIDPLVKEYRNKGYHIRIFEEHPSYIGGEETALLNAIEGKRTSPRLKPPYPAEHGLFSCPTLVHNVETLYNVALVKEGKYENKRFYCLSGEMKNPGVYYLPNTWTIEQVLKETNNIPTFDFFVQVGGSASGPVFNKTQIGAHRVTGAGSIEIYRSNATPPKKILTKWFEFYASESCGKCTPCRDGTFQLHKLITDKNEKEIPWEKIMEIIENMEKTSFCGLGLSIGIPIRTYIANILGGETGRKKREKQKKETKKVAVSKKKSPATKRKTTKK